MKHEVTNNPFKSVTGQKAKKLFELVEHGKTVKEAEKEAEISVKEIARMEDLGEYAQRLVDKYNIKDTLGKAVLASKMFEILLGEDDKNAIAAAGVLSKILHPQEKGGTNLGVQVVINESPETARFMKRTLEFEDYQVVDEEKD